MRRSPGIGILVGLTSIPLALSGQTPSRYLAPADTVYYAIANPYHMYLVRGSDTLGTPLTQRTIEAQFWHQETTGGLSVDLSSVSLDVYRREVHDTFLLTPSGEVESTNGKDPALNPRQDLVPRLPAGTMAPWTTWRDTLDHRETGPGGPHWFTVDRTYRIRRWVDTLGGHVVEITGTGTVGYRDGWWADSSAGTYSWIEVAGPITETAWFDPDRGLLVGRRWRMDLKGTGGAGGPGVPGDTMPAGLRSTEIQQLLEPAEAHLRARPLPGTDTTITIARVPILLHTAEHTGDSVESSLSRNDGTVGTVRLRFDHGRPAEYHALWTDSAGRVSAVSAFAAASGLTVSRLGTRDTVTAPPVATWGIADDDMDELLVPLLLALPSDGGSLPMAVYRPLRGIWEQGTTTAREIDGIRAVTLSLGAAARPQYLLITPEGDLLLVEVPGDSGKQRLPRRGSPRRQRLDAILAALGAAHG